MKLHVPLPKPRWFGVLLRISGVLTLLALALMVWSVIQPTPMPVLVAMSLGQVLGTLAFALFGLVVFADLRRQYVRRDELARTGKGETAASPSASADENPTTSASEQPAASSTPDQEAPP